MKYFREKKLRDLNVYDVFRFSSEALAERWPGDHVNLGKVPGHGSFSFRSIHSNKEHKTLGSANVCTPDGNRRVPISPRPKKAKPRPESTAGLSPDKVRRKRWPSTKPRPESIVEPNPPTMSYGFLPITGALICHLRDGGKPDPSDIVTVIPECPTGNDKALPWVMTLGRFRVMVENLNQRLKEMESAVDG